WALAAAWLLLPGGPVRPRGRAAALLALACLVPLAALVAPNGCFQGRFLLTVSLARNLADRIQAGMPPPPPAPLGSAPEIERARRLAWETRRASWLGPYEALRREFGWEDARIDALMRRLYVDQVCAHPQAFLAASLDTFGGMFLRSDTFVAAAAAHDASLGPHSGFGWDRKLPRVESVPALLAWTDALGARLALVLLFAAAVAPVVATGRARRLALLAAGSAAYFLVLTSLLQVAAPRYRTPAMPFLAVAAGAGLGGRLRAGKRDGERTCAIA
ncbi:MAG: hypothetical protein HZA54_07390, partial [Planctomycetes bacterium]|nr:hypothetical protein [Planctomycetota bacterium]